MAIVQVTHMIMPAANVCSGFRKRGIPDWQAESLNRFPDASAAAIDDLVAEIIASRSLPTRQSNRSLYDRLTKSRKDNKLTDARRSSVA